MTTKKNTKKKKEKKGKNLEKDCFIILDLQFCVVFFFE